VERNIYMCFTWNGVLLHTSFPTGLLRLTEHVIIPVLGSNPRKQFFFFFSGVGEQGKELSIFSPSTMSSEFDLMHLEITDTLAFHWWMMEMN